MITPRLVMGLLASLLYLFIFLCVARTIVSWFTPAIPRVGKLEAVLGKMTDWYLGLFRKLKFLRLGRLDFSATFGILLLVIPATALAMFVGDARPSPLALLAVFISSLWSAVAFLLGVLILLLITRLIASRAGKGGDSSAMYAIEELTDPLALRISKLVFAGRKVSQRTVLITAILTLLGILVVGAVLIWLLTAFLSSRS